MPDQSETPSARELDSLLQSTETYLRVMASSNLPYSSVVRIEKAAWRLTQELLAGLEDLEPQDEGIEELVAAAAFDLAAAPQGTPSAFSAMVADEEPTVFVSLPGAQAVGEEQATEELSASDAAWVSFEEPVTPSEEEVYVPAPTPRPSVRVAEPSYVSFEEMPLDDEDGETQILVLDPAGGEPKAIDYSGLDAETLNSDDGLHLEPLADDEVISLSDDAVQPLELDDPLPAATPRPQARRTAGSVETFDLIPELSDDDLSLEVEEDEDVTSPHSVDALRRAAREELRGGRGAGGGASVSTSDAVAATQRLYAGSQGSVPTIRESGAIRPRAAAVQVNAGAGTGQVVGLDEEAEPIEIGSAEDYGEEIEFDDEGGFRLEVQEYEDDLVPYEDEDEAEDDEVVQPAARMPIPVPVRPSDAELAELFARAREAAESGDMQRGTDLYSDVIDADPDHLDAYVGRGRLYLDLGDYSRAMSDFMIAEDMAPSNPEPQIAIGDLYFARKDYRKAIDYFNAALNADPNHAMAFCRRGISHYYRKNYPDSLSDLQKAEELDPEIPNIGTYINMARKKARK